MQSAAHLDDFCCTTATCSYALYMLSWRLPKCAARTPEPTEDLPRSPPHLTQRHKTSELWHPTLQHSMACLNLRGPAAVPGKQGLMMLPLLQASLSPPATDPEDVISCGSAISPQHECFPGLFPARVLEDLLLLKPAFCNRILSLISAERQQAEPSLCSTSRDSWCCVCHVSTSGSRAQAGPAAEARHQEMHEAGESVHLPKLHMFAWQLLACAAFSDWLALLCAGLGVQASQECDCLCKTWNCYCGQP